MAISLTRNLPLMRQNLMPSRIFTGRRTLRRETEKNAMIDTVVAELDVDTAHDELVTSPSFCFLKGVPSFGQTGALRQQGSSHFNHKSEQPGPDGIT